MYKVNKSLSFNSAEQVADYIAEKLDQKCSDIREEEGYDCAKRAIRNLALDYIEELRPGKSTMCMGHRVTFEKIKEEQA